MTENPLSRKDQVIAEELSGECVIYDSRQKKAHHLNPTLTWIWRRCDGSNSIDAMAAAFENHFDTQNGMEIVLSGLDQLQSCQLLETPITIPCLTADEKNSVSRRAVVMATSILMPAVISILAPTPASAQSPGNGKGNGKGNGSGKGNGKE